MATKLSESDNIAHLDLDTLAWRPTQPPERESLEKSHEKILAFISANESWVIEGGYTDLLELVFFDATEIIFSNLPVALCIENAKNRPWESHKYSSKAAQDKNLNMLIEWITQYTHRDDVFSYKSHMKFYDSFEGKKSMLEHNTCNT